jgi:hypothetical protein
MMCVGNAFSQSSDQQFPTPVRSSEISSVIKARDIGDSRSTTHYYTFEGEQGDLFINVQTRNFTGDIDVFVVQGLRPLTKMVLYADVTETETGRVIYLRKHETILLRIQGRTPDDDDASYRIKFAGSFAVSKAVGDGADSAPTVANTRQSGNQVNSVGTIIARPTPEVREKEVEVAVAENPKEESKRAADAAPTKKAPTVKVTDPVAEKPKRSARTPAVNKPKREPEKTDERTATDRPRQPTPDTKRTAREPKATPRDPMAGVNLSIKLKSGKVIEKPMTEVYRFTVERAVLTVINSDGSLTRYQMIDVASVTIEPEN